jgi:hypothetical protein
MARTSTPTIERQLTNTKTKLAAVGAIICGFFSVYLKLQFTSPYFIAAAEAVASTLISLGAISLIVDLYLRRELQAELVRFVGIEQSIVANRVSGVARYSDVNWTGVLERKSLYRCLLIDPLPWIEANWQTIADSAKQRQIVLHVLIPDPKEEYIGQLASYSGMPANQLSSSIERAAAIVEERWKALSHGGVIHHG